MTGRIGLKIMCLHMAFTDQRWFDDSRWRVKKYRGLELYTDVQTDEELAMEKELHMIRDEIREPLAAFEKQFETIRKMDEM